MIANHADLIARLRTVHSRGYLLYMSDLDLMREAADAIASCDTALEEMTERAEGAEAQMELRRQWMDKALARAEAAESALATERAKVARECANIADKRADNYIGRYGFPTTGGIAMKETEAAIRALIPATTGATEPSASGVLGDCVLGNKCRCVSEPQLCPNWQDAAPVSSTPQTEQEPSDG